MALLFAVAWLPFVGRPLHVDDPLFVWGARHFLANPADPYGFTVNWYGSATPFTEAMQNPPLVWIWQGAWASVFGWSEPSLHLAMLPFALAALAGTWELARSLGGPPIESTLVLAFSPAFFLSSTTLMCDVPHLAIWTWSIVLWVRGIRSGSGWSLGGGACLAAVAPLVKYVGIGLIPLLLVYGWAARRRPGWWALWMAIPLAAVAAFEMGTRALYGEGLILGAVRFASTVSGRAHEGAPGKLASGMAFLGGAAVLLAFQPLRLWSRRELGLLALLALAIGASFLGGRLGPPAALQLGLLASLGAGLLWLVADEIRREPSPEGVLLAAWTIGIVAFALRVNWSLNVRSVLTLVPALAVIASRRAARRGTAPRGNGVRWVPHLVGAALSIALAFADTTLAETARDAARVGAAQMGRADEKGRFLGNWGFQWYAEQEGLLKVDADRSELAPGCLVLLPGTNGNSVEIPPGAVVLRNTIYLQPVGWVATMSPALGAGFYADAFGPLPFAFGWVPPERYVIAEVVRPIRPPSP